MFYKVNKVFKKIHIQNKMKLSQNSSKLYMNKKTKQNILENKLINYNIKLMIKIMKLIIQTIKTEYLGRKVAHSNNKFQSQKNQIINKNYKHRLIKKQGKKLKIPYNN